MRILLSLLVFLLPIYAHAATTKPAPTHMTLHQRFEQANTTHDGHLTLDQAHAGYKSIARHFDAIDRDKKGYVSEDDIRAYYKTQRTLHHQASSGHKTPNG
jgi:hypothetical protein